MAFKVADGYVEINVRYDRGKLNRAAREAGDDAGRGFGDSFSRRAGRSVRGNFFRKGFASAEARRAGDSAGKSFGDGFSRSASRGVRRNLFAKNFASGEAGRAGNSAGRAFGLNFSRSASRGVRRDLFGKDLGSRQAGSAGQQAGHVFGERFSGSARRSLSSRLFDRLHGEAGRSGTLGGQSYSRGFARGSSGLGSGLTRSFRAMRRPLGAESSSMGRVMANSLGRNMNDGMSQWWSQGVNLTKGHLVIMGGVLAAGAPLLGATLATGITLAFGAGIGAIGIIAASQSQRVKNAFSSMKTTVVNDFRQMAKPLEDPLIRVANRALWLHQQLKGAFSRAFIDIGAAIDNATPRIARGFAAWSPAIEGAGRAFRALSASIDFEGRLAKIGGSFAKLFQVIEDNPKPFGGIVNGALDLVAGLIDLTTWLAKTYAQFSVDLGPATSNFSANMRQLVSVLKNLGENIGPVASQAIEDLMNSFGNRQDARDATREINGFNRAVDQVFALFNVADEKFRIFSAAWYGSADAVRNAWPSKFSAMKNGWNNLWSGSLSGSGVATVFGGLAASIGSWWGRISNQWNNSLGQLRNGWNRLWSQGFSATPIAQIMGRVGSAVSNGVNTVVNWFGSMRTRVGSSLGGFGSSVSRTFTASRLVMGNSAMGAASAVVNWFSSMRTRTAAVISGWVTAIGSWFGSVRARMVSGISGAVNSVVGWFSSMRVRVSAVVVGWATSIGAWFGLVGSRMRNIISGAVNAVVSWFSSMRVRVASVVTGWAASIGAWFGLVGSRMRNIISGAVNAVVGWFSSMRIRVTTVIAGWAGAIGSWFSTVGTRMRAYISSAVNAVVSWFSNMRVRVTAVVSGWVAAVTGFLSRLGTRMRAYISTAVNSVVGWFSSMRIRVTAVVSGWVAAVTGFLSRLGTRMRAYVSTAVNAVVAWFSSMRIRVTNVVTGWVATVTRWLSIIGTRMRAYISSAVNAVVSWFSSMRVRVTNVVTGWVATVTRWLSVIGSRMRAYISSAVNSVVGWFSNMRVRVTKVVAGWGSWTSSRFKAVRNWVVNHASSLRNGVVDRFASLKNSAIKIFNSMQKGIGVVWNKVKKAASNPVKFMVHTVYNNGILNMYRKIRSVVPALPEMKKAQLPKGFAKGGIMPGYTPGRDVHQVRGPNGPVGLSGGEAIMRPEWTKVMGADFVNNMNALARKRGTQGIKDAMTPNLTSPGAYLDQLKKATALREPSPLGVSGKAGYAKGGIFGKIGDFIGTAKDKLSEGFMGPVKGIVNPLINSLRDKFGKGGIPNIPFHLMKMIGPKFLSVLKSAEDSLMGGGSAEDVVNLARKQIGKHPESGGNNTNDITKWYGMNGAPWCAMFISWLFDKAGAGPALKKAKRTAYTGDYYSSGMKRVPGSARLPGDIAVYGRDHVNMVETKKSRIGGNQSNNVTRSGQTGGAIFRPDWSKTGGAGGGGNAVFTSFWDPTTASGTRMNSQTIASSYIPMGTKMRVKIGGKSANGTVEDLGPAKFVYDRHKGKAVLDLAEPMMQKLTGRRSNTTTGSFRITKRGNGRTLYGTRWRGYDQGGIVDGGGLGSGSHDIGGMVPDKAVAHNRSGEAEVVQTLDQIKAMAKIAENGDTYYVTINCNVDEIDDIKKIKRIFEGLGQTARAHGARNLNRGNY